MMSNATHFAPYFKGILKLTVWLMPLIPPDRLEWRPAQGSMSFGNLLRHLADTERWMWADNVAGRPALFSGHDESLARGYAAACAYFERLHGESLGIFDTWCCG